MEFSLKKFSSLLLFHYNYVKKSHNYFIIFFCCLSCNWPEEPEPDIGRLPELRIEISPDQGFWMPEVSSIGATNNSLFLNTFSIDGIGRKLNEFRFDFVLADQLLDWRNPFTLDDLLFPNELKSSYKEVNPKSLRTESLRIGNRPEFGAVLIHSIETVNNRNYASGEFSMLVCNNILSPPCLELNGIFNDIQIFFDGSERVRYEIDLINALKER